MPFGRERNAFLMHELGDKFGNIYWHWRLRWLQWKCVALSLLIWNVMGTFEVEVPWLFRILNEWFMMIHAIILDDMDLKTDWTIRIAEFRAKIHTLIKYVENSCFEIVMDLPCSMHAIDAVECRSQKRKSKTKNCLNSWRCCLSVLSIRGRLQTRNQR